MSNTATLKIDIFSNKSENKKDFPKYCSKGDTVTLIADHNEVWIVEGKNGNRFSVRTENLIIKQT